jgi:hypothetical protein
MFSAVEYWRQRYAKGGKAGCGSIGRLKAHKVETVARLWRKYGLTDVLDLGAGNGEMWPELPQAVGGWLHYIPADPCTTPKTAWPPTCKRSAVLSLDVLFHLPDSELREYLALAFRLALRAVIIYAPDFDAPAGKYGRHVFLRKWTPIVASEYQQWRLAEVLPNAYPVVGAPTDDTSWSQWHVYLRGEP